MALVKDISSNEWVNNFTKLNSCSETLKHNLFLDLLIVHWDWRVEEFVAVMKSGGHCWHRLNAPLTVLFLYEPMAHGVQTVLPTVSVSKPSGQTSGERRKNSSYNYDSIHDLFVRKPSGQTSGERKTVHTIMTRYMTCLSENHQDRHLEKEKQFIQLWLDTWLVCPITIRTAIRRKKHYACSHGLMTN